MSQLCTAQFIDDSGFVTGLTPTVTINEALTGNLVGVFDMTETSEGNYVYNFVTNTETVVYFFKYDAGTDDIINRYMGNNNKIETSFPRGGGVVNNNTITKEKMKEIAEMVVEMLPESKETMLDTSKIEEKLVLIEDKIDLSDIEFDYGKILDGQAKNTQKIIKKVEGIKFPKIKDYDDRKVIEAIKKVEDKIELDDIKEQTKKIKTKKEMKEEELAEKIVEKISEQLEEELPEIMQDCLKQEPEFISLIEGDDNNER